MPSPAETWIVRVRPRGASDAPVVYGRLASPDADRIEEITDPFAGPPAPTGRVHRRDAVDWLPPTTPSKIVCVGKNYRDHAAEMGSDVPPEPILFLKPPSALIATEATIRLPREIGPVHHEGELVLVVGRRCRDLDDATVAGAVLGVTCGNDVSARALQQKDGQWTRAKGFDTFAPVGPAIAVGVDPRALELRVRVNGAERQRASTAEMVVGPFALLAFVSSVMTLEPGDLLFTGTPAGVGELAARDVVEVELGGVGVLRNRVELA